ncbi:nitrous oxide reductase accessory protein NosL [Pseudogracilibacillus sp. SO30301A]|uniref:nitrous oxide reductase accessory protein NosL n=1 Tax=Pseudogracilibacillus sp. SO30301A TaxID=3098291 RepID=UPI00300E62A0
MKKCNFMFIVLAIFTIVLAACGKETNNNTTKNSDDANADITETEELAYEPEDIHDTDVCEVCAMAVPQNEHATQIILTNDKALKFDDLGCLYQWKEENGEDDIGAEFVRDFNTEEWIQLKEATFVYDEEIVTPMAYGVISFKEKADAEAFNEDEGIGEILDADALANHQWKMNKESMDHGEHEDHEDHDEHTEE